jgi:cytosine/uracil/thiamine/allantoin permease
MPVRQVSLPERERVGYEVSYVVPRAAKAIDTLPLWRRIRTEERIGSLTFWGGSAWAVQIATKDISNLFRLLLTSGPLEVCAVGLLIWLHAKWRRSVRIN